MYASGNEVGEEAAPIASPSKGDKRFKDQEWEDNAVFDYIKQSYLMTARWMQDTVHKVDGIDDKQRKKIDFYTRQFVDALAPSNFVGTNPAVIRATMESGGENLVASRTTAEGAKRELTKLAHFEGPGAPRNSYA